MSNWDILSTTLLWKMHYPIVCIVLSFMKKRSICIKSNSPSKEVLPKNLPQFLFNCGKNISWEHNGNKKFYFRKRNTLCTFFFPVRNKKVWWPKIVRLFLIDSCFMIWRLSKRYNLALNQSLLLETRHELVNSIDLKYDNLDLNHFYCLIKESNILPQNYILIWKKYLNYLCDKKWGPSLAERLPAYTSTPSGDWTTSERYICWTTKLF